METGEDCHGMFGQTSDIIRIYDHHAHTTDYPHPITSCTYTVSFITSVDVLDRGF